EWGLAPAIPPYALVLYMMIRHIRPKRYIEVGSGLSTYYCSLAAARNSSEGYPLAITCREPYPFEKLRTIPNIDIKAPRTIAGFGDSALAERTSAGLVPR